MKVACLQLKPEFGQRDKNLEKARQAILEASRQDVRLAVLPELYTSGYIMEDREEALSLAEPVPGGETVKAYEAMAGESGCAIVAGLPERDGDRVYNSCVVVTPEGYVGAYRKIHLFFKETEWFDAGDSPPPVYDVFGTKIGLMICWDWIFPETARSLALQGAQVLVHPSNLVLRFCQDAMITRCLENRVFAVTCNRVGSESRGGLNLTFTGKSQITGLNGTVLAHGSLKGEETVVAELRPQEADNKFATEYNNLIEQRRPDLYVTR